MTSQQAFISEKKHLLLFFLRALKSTMLGTTDSIALITRVLHLFITLVCRVEYSNEISCTLMSIIPYLSSHAHLHQVDGFRGWGD